MEYSIAGAVLGFAAGSILVWLLMRGRIAEAVAAGTSNVSVQLAAAQERIRSLEAAEAVHAEFEADAVNWRDQLGNLRAERAQLQERASRVPILEQKTQELDKDLAAARNREAELREQASRTGAELIAQQEQLGTARGELEAKSLQCSTAEVAVSELKSQLSELAARQDAERQAGEEKLKLLTEAKTALTDQFKSLANDILEEKTKRFTEQNKANLSQLLGPLQTKLTEFQTKVEAIHVEETRDRTTLAEQVRQLVGLNQSLSQDAQNLTRALTSSGRSQGAWGEFILERILESSGLRNGEEYATQESHTREDGTRAQPDVVIKLPEDRHIVVDAKVSLTAYARSVSAECDEDRIAAVEAHLQSVRGHLNGLSERNYQLLYGLKSLDCVLMFVPIESAFMLAITHDQSLFMDAWKRNVILVSPSTLLCVLRTVAQLWRQEAQNRNAQEIAQRGARLYDELVAFVEDLEDVGRHIQRAQASYGGARKKLTEKKGSVVRQAEMLRKLGVKPTKPLPSPIIDVALDGVDEEDEGPLPLTSAVELGARATASDTGT